MSAGAALVALSATAGAQVPSSKTTGDSVDISPVADKLVIAHDGRGHYIVMGTLLIRELFYGDGKTFYKQSTFGGATDRKAIKTASSFWAPTSLSNGTAQMDKDRIEIKCRGRLTKLTTLSAKETAAMLKTAKFKPRLWRRTAHRLARDRIGRYYYVDRLTDANGGKDFRLFIGRQGAMKKMKLRDIVSDSEGEVFATPKGDFRLVLDRSEAAWVKGKKSIDLTIVPTDTNVPLIYNQLGVYNNVYGTPCDDF